MKLNSDISGICDDLLGRVPNFTFADLLDEMLNPTVMKATLPASGFDQYEANLRRDWNRHRYGSNPYFMTAVTA